MAVNFPMKAGEKNWVQVQLEEIELQFNGWLANQPMGLLGATTIHAGIGAIAGGSIGWLIGNLKDSIAQRFPALDLMACLKESPISILPLAGALHGGPRVQARNFAIMLGAHAGISNLTKEWGKCETSFASGFGSGALFSLACDGGHPFSISNAFAYGIIFGLVQCQISQRVLESQREALNYVKTESMLRSLGLKKFEYKFKKAFIMDATLALLTERALKEVKIPIGARLLIMDYIEREPEYKDRRKSLKLSVHDVSDGTAANSTQL